MSDPVNHPAHYNLGKIEVIEFIEDKNLNFHLGNAVKYIARAGKKDPNKEVEDLRKAIWYINRYLEVLNGTNLDQTKQQSKEEVAGIGEWQSKLAELLKFNQKKIGDAFLFASKRRDVSARALQIGFLAVEALRENSRLIITHFNQHETRESYAKDLYERLVK